MATDATKTLEKSAQFVKHAALTINEQAQQLEKVAAMKKMADSLIHAAVKAVHAANLISEDELVKAASAFGDHAKTLKFLTDVANHLTTTAAPLGAPTGESVKVAETHAAIPADELAMAEKLGCTDSLRAAYAAQRS